MADTIGTAYIQIEPEAKGIQGKISEAINGGTSGYGKSLSGALGAAAKIGGAALTAATTAVGAFGASSVKAGSEFDSSMSQVAATMGLTMDEMETQVGSVDLAWGSFSGNLREYAQEMGKNTAFSATEAADALNFMALAGYDAQTSMEMLPNVLNLAAAGSMDLATASDMVTDTQTAFGISLERTSKMVDEMAKASSTGNTSVEQLGEAFLTVGGLAQELNGGMVTLADGTTASTDGVQELEIALTAMANAGVKGSEAGTHMRNMLLKLSSPTDKGTMALEEMGVAVFDAAGNMRSLKDIFGDLNGELSNMTQAGQIETISALFNTRDLASAEALLNAVGQDWDAIGESILGASYNMTDLEDALAGSLDWSQYSGNFAVGMDEAIGGITADIEYDLQSLGLSAAETADYIASEYGLSMEDAATAVNAVKEAMDSATGAAQQMADTQLDNLQGDMTLFQSALEGAQIAVSDVLTPSLREFVQFGTDGLSQLTSAFQEGGLSGAMEAFGTILSDGLNMVIEMLPQAIDAGMQLLGALGQGILDNLPTIIDAAIQIIDMLCQGLIEALPALAEGAVQLIGQLASGIGEMLPTLIPAAIDMILTIVQGLIDNIGMLVEGAIQLVTGLAQGLIEALPILIERLPEMISSIVTALIDNLPILIEAVIQIVISLVEAIIQNLPLIIEAIIQIQIALVQALFEALPMLLGCIVEILEGIVQLLVEGVPMLIGAIGEIISGIMGRIGEAAGEFVGKVAEIGGQVLSAMGQWLSQLPETLAYWAGYAIGSFIKFFTELPGKLSQIWESVKSGVTSFASNFVKKAGEMAKNFFNSLVNGIRNLPSKMRDLGSQLVGAIKELPEKFLSIGSDIVKGIWNGISEGWKWLTDKVKDLADSLVKGVKDALGIESPSKVFAAEVGRWIPAGIAVGIEDNTGVLDDAITGMVNGALSVTDISGISTAMRPAYAMDGDYPGVAYGGFVQNVNIYSPRELTPSETARQLKNATRNTVLSLRGK